MATDMLKRTFHLWLSGVLLFAGIFCFFPRVAYSAQLYHTISISSFSNMTPAEQQFESITGALKPQELDHLRIEKIGNFYCVRLGKFDDKASADQFYASIQGNLPGATIMKAYIKDERILKLYSAVTPHESTLQQSEPEVPAEKKEVLDAEQPEQASTLEESLAKIPDLVQKSDYKAALAILESEIALHPEHPELNAWIGMVHLKMDQPSDSLEYLQKAASLSPGKPEYHNSLGYSLLFLERFDQAIDEFKSAIRLDPGYYDSLTGLCMSYAKRGKKEEAMMIYNKIKNHDEVTSAKLLKLIHQ